MTTATFVPLAEYLTTSYHPDRDWVEGELRERNMGDFFHSSVQRLILKYFLLREEELRLSAFPELRLQVSATNLRVPDILLLPLGMAYDSVVMDAPLLCVEVLSPDDRARDIEEKVEDYLRMGVSTVWVIDPRNRNATSIDKYCSVPAQNLTLDGYAFQLKVADIFTQIDDAANRVR